MYDKTKPKCTKCGKEMKSAYDSMTNEFSDYLWQCDCDPNMILSKG